MNDCSNADIRDRLPDLVHDHLDADVRAVIVAHVAECVDCRDELELLRNVHKTLIANTPRVDIAYVVGALPKAPAPRPQIQPARRRWSDWRVAAAVTVLIAGGSSIAVLNRTPAGADARPLITDSVASRALASSAAAPAVSAPNTPNTAARPSSPATVVASNDEPDTSGDDGLDGRFGGLSEAQMQALLSEIDQLKAVPVTEPEPATIRVDVKPSAPEGQP